MAKSPQGTRTPPEGGLATAKRIMGRLVNTPPKPHKDTKADEPAKGQSKRGRPASKKGVGENEG